MFQRAAIVALVGVLLAPGAMAHAILMHSQPEAGGSVPVGKLDMEFTYNSRIDQGRSRLTLTRPDHSQSVLTIAPGGGPNVIDTSTEVAKPGPYVVRWQVLAIDGHITRGDVPFNVTDH